MTTLYTIGHSTRGADEFRELLVGYGVQLLVDVRQFPGSRRYPHFASDALRASLAEQGIGYLHERELGGRRRPRPDSLNVYWRNASFRAYADYMSTLEFDAALAQLIEHAQRKTVAIMCAEAVPWRCHRWLVSDALVVRGMDVIHILDATHHQPHMLNPHARQDDDGHLVYAGEADAEE